MDYAEIKELIHGTLSGKAPDHEITPLEHETLLMNVLEYSRTMQMTGPSVLQGFADSSTNPDMPDNYKVCYIAMIEPSSSVTFTNFKDAQGNSLSVTTSAGEIKWVTLLWNMSYWEIQAKSLTVNE